MLGRRRETWRQEERSATGRRERNYLALSHTKGGCLYSMGVEYIQADITASYTDMSTTEAPAQRPSLCDGEGHLIAHFFHDEGADQRSHMEKGRASH